MRAPGQQPAWAAREKWARPALSRGIGPCDHPGPFVALRTTHVPGKHSPGRPRPSSRRGSLAQISEVPHEFDSRSRQPPINQSAIRAFPPLPAAMTDVGGRHRPPSGATRPSTPRTRQVPVVDRCRHVTPGAARHVIAARHRAACHAGHLTATGQPAAIPESAPSPGSVRTHPFSVARTRPLERDRRPCHADADILPAR